MRPIIFNSTSVEGFLAGRKFQTRRVVKVPRGPSYEGADLSRAWPDNTSPFGPCLKVPCTEDTVQRIFCPYGSVGDRLYVKEAHWRWGLWEVVGLTKRGQPRWRFVAMPYPAAGASNITFRLEPGEREAAREEIGWHKRSPLYLPRHHSRLVLELEAARFHRLQEVSEENARAEGILGRPSCLGGYIYEVNGRTYRTVIGAFETLWDSINGDRPGCSWEDDPWVVALTLRRCS